MQNGEWMRSELVQNALDAVRNIESDKRKITLAVFQENTVAYITITVTGCGIKPENIQKIFSQGYSTKKQGHGFALHSCANYMDEMGGSISAHSNGLNQGAEFKLSFPI